jgi:hypothetical protein
MRKAFLLFVLMLAALAATSTVSPAATTTCPKGSHLIVCPTSSFCCPNNAFCVCGP